MYTARIEIATELGARTVEFTARSQPELCTRLILLDRQHAIIGGEIDTVDSVIMIDFDARPSIDEETAIEPIDCPDAPEWFNEMIDRRRNADDCYKLIPII